jgi:hypothetical protein
MMTFPLELSYLNMRKISENDLLAWIFNPPSCNYLALQKKYKMSCQNFVIFFLNKNFQRISFFIVETKHKDSPVSDWHLCYIVYKALLNFPKGSLVQSLRKKSKLLSSFHGACSSIHFLSLGEKKILFLHQHF